MLVRVMILSKSLNWIPYGGYKSWSFTIRAKSNILRDLKYERKKDFRDYD